MNFLDINIQTDRLSLVPVSLEYANQMLKELTEEITKYLSFYPPKSLEEENEFIEKSRKEMENGESIVLAILDKSNREYLGNVGLTNIKTKTPEMGIWIKKGAHGKKIGREAAVALKEWAFKNLELDYVLYTMDINNIASKKIAESLGGKFIKTEIINFPSGKSHLDHFYHILPE
jgi:[ribosomal protein S5]-alanine N-acetyltransferase